MSEVTACQGSFAQCRRLLRIAE